MRIPERDAFTAQPVKRRRIGFGDAVGAQAVDDEYQVKSSGLCMCAADDAYERERLRESDENTAHVSPPKKRRVRSLRRGGYLYYGESITGMLRFRALR